MCIRDRHGMAGKTSEQQASLRSTGMKGDCELGFGAPQCTRHLVRTKWYVRSNSKYAGFYQTLACPHAQQAKHTVTPTQNTETVMPGKKTETFYSTYKQIGNEIDGVD